MRIVCLIENTEGSSGCAAEHGLSFYVETAKHKLLVDTGAGTLFAENAKRLGVDLTAVDTVVLSHGHYDHGGGLPEFLKINSIAKIYMQQSAFGEHYGIDYEGAEPRYIGLSADLRQSDRIVYTGEELEIDSELFLFGSIGSGLPAPAGNATLHIKTEKGMIRDDFRHEQCLVISEDGAKILFSGCAHHGILNILAKFRQLFGTDPDAVLSGFHMMRKTGYTEEDFRDVDQTAYELKKTKTKYYTGHCTGAEPFAELKKILGDQLEYVHCGDEIVIGQDQRGRAE